MTKNVEHLAYGDYIKLRGVNFGVERVVHREIDVSVHGLDGESVSAAYGTPVQIHWNFHEMD